MLDPSHVLCSFARPRNSNNNRALYSDLGITALVCREKVEKLCVCWGGPFFEKMGRGIVHFGRGGRFRFSLENLMVFGFCGIPR